MKVEVGQGKHKKDVYPLIVKLAVRTRRNFAAAELDDVISEGIVEALVESEKFDPKHKASASISTFLYRRLHGAMADFMNLESRVREPWETGESAQEEIQKVAAPNHMEEAVSNRKLFLEAIHLIETYLEDATACVLVRYYLEGVSEDAIAYELKRPKKEIRRLRLLGLEELRKAFAARGRTEHWVG